VPSLRALHDRGHDLVLVVTQPDRPGHRLKLTPPPVKPAALGLGLEVYQPEKVRDPEAVRRIAAARPDLLVVAAYGQILPRELLELPPRGAINVHASLLPRWRGAAPIAHAILAGDQVTGVTIMLMDELLDHGPILAQRETPIGPDEDAAGLGKRLATMGAELLAGVLDRIDELQPREQDHARARAAPRLKREDGELQWSLPAAEIDRRVRAFQPWPGVTLPLGGGRVKVLQGRSAAGGGRPGEVLRRQPEGLVVAAGEGAYRLEVVQLPGRRPMPARQLAAAGA